MQPNNDPNLQIGVLYLGDTEIPVKDFTCTKEWAESTQYVYNLDSGEFSFTITNPNWTRMLFLKLCGVWQAVVDMCPNRKVAHLIRYGKNDKIRKKNFNRAIRLIYKEGRK